jgi:hypothetical protein
VHHLEHRLEIDMPSFLQAQLAQIQLRAKGKEIGDLRGKLASLQHGSVPSAQVHALKRAFEAEKVGRRSQKPPTFYIPCR